MTRTQVMDDFTLMDVIAQYIGEILVGGVLMVFGFAFQSWAKGLRSSTDRILNKLEGLVIEFHNHRIDIENRVTRVETKVDIDRIERRELRDEFRDLRDGGGK